MNLCKDWLTGIQGAERTISWPRAHLFIPVHTPSHTWRGLYMSRGHHHLFVKRLLHLLQRATCDHHWETGPGEGACPDPRSWLRTTWDENSRSMVYTMWALGKHIPFPVTPPAVSINKYYPNECQMSPKSGLGVTG